MNYSFTLEGGGGEDKEEGEGACYQRYLHPEIPYKTTFLLPFCGKTRTY
jgi:hypothetical protein